MMVRAVIGYGNREVRRYLMKAWKSFIVVGVGGVLAAIGVARAVTTDVFRVKAKIDGAVEYFSITNEVTKVKTNGVTIRITNEVVNAEIISVTLNDEDIINLAMGRELGTKQPDNEVLGVTTRCGDGVLQWVVYDKEATNIAAIIGDFIPKIRAVGVKKKKEQMEQLSTLNILPNGSPTNAFLGGILSADIESELNSNGCVKNATVTMIGWIETIISSNNYQTASNPVALQPVIIRKSTLKTENEKPVGSIVTTVN
jgi:hypothetical protein